VPFTSTTPSDTGNNLDNRRLGKGATLYLPVKVPGGLLAVSPACVDGMLLGKHCVADPAARILHPVYSMPCHRVMSCSGRYIVHDGTLTTLDGCCCTADGGLPRSPG
jgi:hypothetical protein